MAIAQAENSMRQNASSSGVATGQRRNSGFALIANERKHSELRF